MIFSNFPYSTDDEIEQLFAPDLTLIQLKVRIEMEQKRFTHYQNNPFYKPNSEQHLAHLATLDKIVKKCLEKIETYEQSSLQIQN